MLHECHHKWYTGTHAERSLITIFFFSSFGVEDVDGAGYERNKTSRVSDACELKKYQKKNSTVMFVYISLPMVLYLMFCIFRQTND